MFYIWGYGCLKTSKLTMLQIFQHVLGSCPQCIIFTIDYFSTLMLASHCPELDTRWPHEYGILNFARRWPRTWSPANQQPKQLRCLQKVTRWQPNHTRRQHEDVIFYQVTYPQDTRRLHDSYTTSYWEYDAFELGHECVTWSPDGINPL